MDSRAAAVIASVSLIALSASAAPAVVEVVA